MRIFFIFLNNIIIFIKSRDLFSRVRIIFIGLTSIIIFLVIIYISKAFVSFYDYKYHVNFRAEINKKFFLFLLKNEIKKDYVKLISPKLKKNDSKLDSFNITIKPEHIKNLNSNLPNSGRDKYYPAYLRINNQKTQKIKIRYRGDNPFHWFYEKKSLRILLKKNNLYKMERKLNIVNPSFSLSFADVANYQVSRELGLISPNFYPVILFVNGEYMGVYNYLSQTDESLLRKHKKMPGSIYSGEPDRELSYAVINENGKALVKHDGKYIGLFNYNPKELGIKKFKKIPGNFYSNEIDPKKNYEVFDKKTGIWTRPNLWPKMSSRNFEQKNNRDDINFFLNSINKSSKEEFYKFFNRYINKESFYNFTALDRITGAFHHDIIHNHRWYFDPYKGKFEPIQWDLRYWSDHQKLKDVNNYPLLQNVNFNPILAYELDKVTYKLYQENVMERLLDVYKKSLNKVENELKADKFKKHDFNYNFEKQPIAYSSPIAYQDYLNAFEYNKNEIIKRKQIVLKILDSTDIKFELGPISDKKSYLKFFVSSNSPVIVDFTKLDIDIKRYFENKEIELNKKIEILYPGRQIKDRINFFASTWRGDKEIFNEIQVYKYILNSPENEIDLNQINYSNAVTGKKVVPEKIANKLNIKSSSIHPWKIALPETQNIILENIVYVSKDIEYHENETVTIKPGTTFVMDSGVSIIFYGKVNAVGTKNNHIKFLPKDTDKPWGSIILHGKSTNGSKFKFVDFEGGSLTTKNLVNYTAQFNIHDNDNFVVENCTFKNNLIGDDNMHVAYSEGVIMNSFFYNSHADALDIDISKVRIKDNVFNVSGNDGIDLMTSDVNIVNNVISKSGDKGISIGEWSENVIINNNIFHNNNIGIATKDKSKVKLDNSIFINSKKSIIEAYNKNWRYDAGGFVLGDNIYVIGNDKTIFDKKSQITIKAKKTSSIPMDFLWYKNLNYITKELMD